MMKRKKSPQLSREDALQEFCDVIDNTGGLRFDEDIGVLVPVEDEIWSDLAAAYLNACRALGREPMVQKKHIQYDVKLALLYPREEVPGTGAAGVLDYLRAHILSPECSHPKLEVVSIKPKEVDGFELDAHIDTGHEEDEG